MSRMALLTVWLSLITAQALAEPIKIPVTQDNSLVLLDGEWSENAGQQGRIRIKGNQHIVALGFDTSALRGRLVKRAELVCVQGEQAITGVTLSTIATPWDERRSTGLTAGMDDIVDWGYTGARFPAVMGGNGFTIVHHVPSQLREGAYHWDVHPDIVHALAVGIAHGIAVHEHDADYGRNPTIFSREQSGRAPYLLVELADATEPAAAPPTQLALTPIDEMSAELTLRAPQMGFAYEVTVNGQPLGRHNIPLVAVGMQQTIPLRDLPVAAMQSGRHEIEVVTLSRTGQRSVPAKVAANLFAAAAIEIPKITLAPSAMATADVAVIPVGDKYDQQGRAIGPLPADYRTHNSIFDGRQVELIAAAGEVAGFQLLLRGQGSVTIDVQFTGFAPRIDLHQALYVAAGEQKIPDPLMPMPELLELSPELDQAIFTDIYVPFDAPPGVHAGSITISDGREIPLRLTILPFALPRRATFLCEMNSYGLPDHVDVYDALQQIAYDHRTHVNILHYSHRTAAAGARKSNLDMRLRSGRRMDNKRYDNIEPGAREAYWEDFTEAFSRYLDGSQFANGHRGPVPPPGFYLTFHESWPLNCRAYFNGNPDAFEAFRDAPVYAQTYINVLQDFGRLAQAKGWTDCGFQVYFNNKGSLHEPQKAPWILDEPSSYWDYRALRYYGELTAQGRQDAKDVQIDYRIDISRPEFHRGQLEQVGDLWVVSSWAFQHYRRLLTDRMRREGMTVWVYGSSNHVHQPNRYVQAWALDAWRHGATGLVPWQTVDKSGQALTQADQLGLFIFDQDASGQTVIRHSARLKAYRDVQQLIEYLNLLKAGRGWTDPQMRRFVDGYVQLDAQVHKENEADAGTTAYGGLSPLGVESLRRAAAELLRRGN